MDDWSPLWFAGWVFVIAFVALTYIGLIGRVLGSL